MSKSKIIYNLLITYIIFNVDLNNGLKIKTIIYERGAGADFWKSARGEGLVLQILKTN